LEFNRHSQHFTCSSARVKVERVYNDPNFNPAGTHRTDLGWIIECRVTLTEGKHHQIRRMASRSKFIVLRLVRTRLAHILDLASVPQAGSCRWLTVQEIKLLRLKLLDTST